MTLPAGLARLVADFQEHGSDVISGRVEKAPGNPPAPGLRPTGQEVFDSLSKEKQDEMLGPEAAEKVRNGEATLADFIEKDGGFIRQKPASDV